MANKISSKHMLLEYGRNKTQKEVEKYIRRYCNPMVGRFLENPLRGLPYSLKYAFGQATETGAWKGVEENGGTLLDYLRINFYSQFGFTYNANIFFAPGVARIAIGELGFYSFNQYEMQGGKIIKLGTLVKIINKKPDLISDLNLNEDFNGMGYEEVIHALEEPIKHFKKQISNELDSDIEESNRYQIIPIEDNIDGMGIAHPIPEHKRFLQQLSNYCDWCICGNMGDMEYAQYVSNGGKFYVCLRDDYKDIPREQGENCPLDDYGLSMIAVIVGPDGHVENTTTRWNHENGGENHDNLWLATHLQKILGVRYKNIFKPRNPQQLRQMHLDESKTPSIYDQVKKVNSAVMTNAAGGDMVCERITRKDIEHMVKECVKRIIKNRC